MKELLEQALRDTDQHAAAELRQMLEAEMQRPAEERDYDRIRALSAACCEMMGAAPEATAARGIQAVRDRLQHDGEEAQCETFVVDVRPPAQSWRILTAAAACLVVVVGCIGGGALLRNQTAEQVPAPLPGYTEVTQDAIQTTAVTVSSAPVTLPAAVPMETVPERMPETVLGAEGAPLMTDRREAPVQTAPAGRPDTPAPVITEPAQTTETTVTVLPTEIAAATEAPDASPDALPGFDGDRWEEDGTQYANIVPGENDQTAHHLKLRYALGWVPAGYQLTSTEDGEEMRTLTYSDGSSTLTLLQRTRYAPPLEPFETGYCPEDYTVTSVRVARYSGWLAESTAGEACVLTWDVGDYLFTLTGDDVNVLQTAALALYICTDD